MDPNRGPNLPLKVRLLIAIHDIVSDLSRRSDATLNRTLLDLFDPKTPPSASKPNHHAAAVSSSDIAVDPSRNLWFRLYTPSTTSLPGSLPVIVYFHGGGFFNGVPNSCAFVALCRRLSKKLPAAVVSVNYRRSPEHRYPAPYEDGLDALKFIDDPRNAVVLPPAADLRRCFIAGDSAGGNIAHHVAIRSCEYGFNRLKIRGVVAIQPFYGGEERTESELRIVGAPMLNLERTDWMWKAFLPVGSDRDHEAANISGPRSADISRLDFPGTLVVVGGFDPLHDWQRRYCDWLKRNGKRVKLVEYPNAFHGFYGFPRLAESSLLIHEIRDFIEKCH